MYRTKIQHEGMKGSTEQKRNKEQMTERKKKTTDETTKKTEQKQRNKINRQHVMK